VRAGRSSTNANVGLTQLLSPTTIGHVDYGVTLQSGTLGNTWNAVPLSTGDLADETLPDFRQRHAFVGRLAQWLPWRGALHLYYRFYVDDWGLLAHTAEAELYQHVTAWLWLRVTYRVHQQNGVSFFTTAALPSQMPRTADSDLDRFVAQTFGGAVGVDLRFIPRLRQLHADSPTSATCAPTICASTSSPPGSACASEPRAKVTRCGSSSRSSSSLPPVPRPAPPARPRRRRRRRQRCRRSSCARSTAGRRASTSFCRGDRRW
jgi:hypothetical protein